MVCFLPLDFLQSFWFLLDSRLRILGVASRLVFRLVNLRCEVVVVVVIPDQWFLRLRRVKVNLDRGELLLDASSLSLLGQCLMPIFML